MDLHNFNISLNLNQYNKGGNLSAIPPGGFSFLESTGCKISFRKLFSLLFLVVKDLASFSAGIAGNLYLFCPRRIKYLNYNLILVCYNLLII